MSKPLWFLPLLLAIFLALNSSGASIAQTDTTLQQGEVELIGQAYPSGSGVGVVFLEAESITTPSGMTTTFKASRDKTVLLTTSTNLTAPLSASILGVSVLVKRYL